MEPLNEFIQSIEQSGLKPIVNLDRPTYVQPEDRIQYRSSRIVVILGMLNTNHGLSKNAIACVDFLLRNEEFQSKFILEYFAGQKNIIQKMSKIEKAYQTEMDFNVVKYKSVPWDLRFNDMFLYLHMRSLMQVKVQSDGKNVRLQLSSIGIEYFNRIKEIFPTELNFLDLFGSRLIEEKAIQIITEVIPNSYWKQNAEANN
jgi:hypothetical protein